MADSKSLDFEKISKSAKEGADDFNNQEGRVPAGVCTDLEPTEDITLEEKLAKAAPGTVVEVSEEELNRGRIYLGDNVNDPVWYRGCEGLELKDIVRNFPYLPYYAVTAIKYIIRFPVKSSIPEDEVQDIDKAIKCLQLVRENIVRANRSE